jgi:hypothetical protein
VEIGVQVGEVEVQVLAGVAAALQGARQVQQGEAALLRRVCWE